MPVILLSCPATDVHFNADYSTAATEGAPYSVAEVELVHAAGDTPPRLALAQVLSELGVPQPAPPVRGKVLEFIYRYDMVRWRALGESGLLAEKLGVY